MSSENPTDRRLAAILFADITGYSAIMQKDEKQASILLHRFQSLLESKLPDYNGEIINFYGDGAFCIFQNPLEAMKYAIALQSEFIKEPRVPVRIGLHSGTVVFEGGRAYGDNVNIASRIESMGIPGAILVSKKVRDELKNQPDILLPSLGEFEFKNIEEPIEVFALANEGFVVPERSQIQGKIKAVKKKPAWKPILVVLGFLLISFLAIKQFTNSNLSSSSAPIATASIPNNSIAVLPFDNLSADPENAYFSEGMHDDLLTHISKIGDLKVISRTSVLQFKENRPPVPEIAKTLGVAHVMEGSIRRSGNQIRINVQLINAETDDHIWSEIYDRELTPDNVFEIQTEIANEIAASLNTNITNAQNIALAARPTDNLEAYENYLKARQLVDSRTPSSIASAKPLIEKAIELDSEFALAYVKLGEIYYLLVEYAFEDSETNYALAWESLEKAKSINQNLAEAYALECTLYHYDKADIAGARIAYEKAIAINPNYATSYFWYSHAVFEIERDAKKALEIIENAIRLNPLSPKFLNMYAIILGGTDQEDKANQNYRKAMELAPDYRVPKGNLSNLYASKGFIDSAVIINYNGLMKAQGNGEFLFDYTIYLEQLEMFEEINAELENFELKNRQDSMFSFFAKGRSAAVQKDFDTMFDNLEKAENISRDIDPAIKFDVFYYTRDYQQAIITYESIYPEAQSGKHLDNYMILGYNQKLSMLEDFQQYIYCLLQTNQTGLGKGLSDRFNDRITSPEEYEFHYERRWRILLQARHLAQEGKNTMAIERLAQYYDNKLMFDWQYTLMDPMFDNLKDDPKFQELNNLIRADAAKQRTSVQSYLRGKS